MLNRSSCSGHLYWESGGGMPPKVEPEPTEGGGDEDEGKTTGCCCCKGKVAPDGPVEVNPDYWADKRNCWSHDPCFCILFLAYWVGMIVVLSVAASNGKRFLSSCSVSTGN